MQINTMMCYDPQVTVKIGMIYFWHVNMKRSIQSNLLHTGLCEQ